MEYEIALKDIKIAYELDTSNQDMKNLYFGLRNDIDIQKKGEKRVFKSFFRNVNKTYQDKEIEKKEESDQIGKPQIKFLNL